jgi:hypothetical protein
MPKEKTVKKVEEKINTDANEKVALFSTNNLFWNEIGSLTIGYNIVSSEKAERWLQHKAVRLATPEEVAKAYGK